MARTNTISADFKVSAGDGADSISASFPSTSFTSGDSTLINGTCGNVAAQSWTVSAFLGAGVAANGVFFENRDAAIAIDVIKVQAASATADYTLAFGE